MHQNHIDGILEGGLLNHVAAQVDGSLCPLPPPPSLASACRFLGCHPLSGLPPVPDQDPDELSGSLSSRSSVHATGQKHARMFGSANVLVVAVEVQDGDIFNVETLNKINRLTIALIETPGVNPWQVLSIAHPKVRNVQITGKGVRVLPLYYPGPPKEPADVARIKKAVYTNDGVLDFFVSRDNKAALITAGFWESGLDFARMKERLFRLQAQETDANHVIHMTGFPMLFCWIFSYKRWIFYITGLTILSIMALLWFYFRTLQGVLIPLFSGALSTMWALGFAGYLGFTIDL